MLTKQMMRQGKPGLFGMIERSTNLRNSRVFVALNVILFIISLVVRFTVWELEMGSCFMWLSAGMTLGAVGSMIYIFSLLLSIPYCSVLYSVFISVVTVMGSFIPLLMTAFMSNYDLNVVRIAPGTVIEVTSTLEATLDTVAVNDAGTKINELTAVLLPGVVMIIIMAVATVSIPAAVRRILLEQYHQFQITRE